MYWLKEVLLILLFACLVNRAFQWRLPGVHFFHFHMTNIAPSSEGVLVVLTTLATQADAQALARQLVERHLVACAQINAIESIYRWQGSIVQDSEWRLLLKTSPNRYAALEAAILELHPYDLPAIVALPCSHALAPFAEWVAQELGAQASSPRSQE